MCILVTRVWPWPWPHDLGTRPWVLDPQIFSQNAFYMFFYNFLNVFILGQLEYMLFEYHALSIPVTWFVRFSTVSKYIFSWAREMAKKQNTLIKKHTKHFSRFLIFIGFFSFTSVILRLWLRAAYYASHSSDVSFWVHVNIVIVNVVITFFHSCDFAADIRVQQKHDRICGATDQSLHAVDWDAQRTPVGLVDAQHDTCLLRMRSIPAVRRTFWCSSRSGGSSPLAIARKYLINNNVYNIRSLQNDYRLIITSTVTGDLKAGPLLSFHCWFGRNTWVRHSSLWSDVSKPSLMAALSYLLQRQLDVAFC